MEERLPRKVDIRLHDLNSIHHEVSLTVAPQLPGCYMSGGEAQRNCGGCGLPGLVLVVPCVDLEIEAGHRTSVVDLEARIVAIERIAEVTRSVAR